MNVLEATGLRKTYESEGVPVRALRGVDMTMAEGEFVAVMGPSGCGKSTLLNLAAGLDNPSDGEIAVAGESLVGKDENELARMRRRHIGIVFQFFNLLEGMSVLENVALPAMIAGSKRRRPRPGPVTCSTSWGWATRPGAHPGCSPAANVNAWPSPGPWPTSPRCSWPTSPRVPSTQREAGKSWSCSGVFTPTARPSCS